MIPFQGTLGLRMIGRSQFKYSRCEIGTLVRLNFFGHSQLIDTLGHRFDNDLGWYLPQMISGTLVRDTKDCQPDPRFFCWALGNTANNYLAKCFMKRWYRFQWCCFYSMIWFTNHLTHMISKQTLTHGFTTLANRNAAGFYPGSFLHQDDSWW